MSNLIDKFLANTERITTRANRLMFLADMLLERIAPKNTAVAFGCWTEEIDFGCALQVGNCPQPYWHRFYKIRRTCCDDGAGTWCYPWEDVIGSCCGTTLQ